MRLPRRHNRFYLYIDPTRVVHRTIPITPEISIDVTWNGKIHGIHRTDGPVDRSTLETVISNIRVR